MLWVMEKSDFPLWMDVRGDLIYIICTKESQIQEVINKMSTDTCILSEYEEWDEGDDMNWILKFKVLHEYDKSPEEN